MYKNRTRTNTPRKHTKNPIQVLLPEKTTSASRPSSEGKNRSPVYLLFNNKNRKSNVYGNIFNRRPIKDIVKANTMETTTLPASTFAFRGKDGQRLKIDHTTIQRVKQQSTEEPISHTDDSISIVTSTTLRPLWKPSRWRPPSPIYGGGEALIKVDSTVYPTTTESYATTLHTIQTTTPSPLKSTSTQSNTTKAIAASSHTKTSDQPTR